MSKSILSKALIILISTVLLTGFLFSDPVEEDLKAYFKKEQELIYPLQREIYDIYTATIKGNYSNEREMLIRVIDKTLLPRSLELKEILENEIIPTEIEIKDIHDLQKDSFNKFIEAIKVLRRILDKIYISEDSALYIEFERLMRNAVELNRKWVDKSNHYSSKYKIKIDFETYAIEKVSSEK